MVLAFRLYGDFHWPPGPGKAPAEDSSSSKTKQDVAEAGRSRDPFRTRGRCQPPSAAALVLGRAAATVIATAASTRTHS
jgi:hypothetical protein